MVRAGVFACAAAAVAASEDHHHHHHSYEVVAEWVTMEYEWGSRKERDDAIASGEYIVENNAMTGLKVCNPAVSTRCEREEVFVTIPRWVSGVPSTLNKVVFGKDGPKLRAWPNKQVQDVSTCDGLQNVQSMEIDTDGVMWVVDVGRKYFNEDDNYDNSCPPKMMLIDVPTGQVVEKYTFPDAVAPYEGSFLNDIVIDVPRQIAYLSSTGNNGTVDPGAIVVYDRQGKRSRRFEDDSTRAEHGHIVIHGEDFSDRLGVLPADGIALAHDGSRVFYCPLGGYHMYSVDAAVLRDFSTSNGRVSDAVEDHGIKPSNSDGMTIGSDGDVFFGGLTTDSMYRWDPKTPLSEARRAITDVDELWWIDTFAWDNKGSIWMTSNKLNLWFFNNMDFSGNSGSNFRIVKKHVGTDSYMKQSRDVSI